MESARGAVTVPRGKKNWQWEDERGRRGRREREQREEATRGRTGRVVAIVDAVVGVFVAVVGISRGGSSRRSRSRRVGVCVPMSP